MKKLFLLLMLSGFVFAAQAQSCAKSCSKKASTTAISKDSDAVLVAAEKVAASDKSIEKRVCEHSGKVSWVRKTENAGVASYEDVQFDGATAKFVSLNTAPTKAACSKGEGKACCAKKGASTSAVSTSAMESTKPACSKGEGKACCAKKKTAAAVDAPAETPQH
ncbi:MAG: hypothetical protein KA974_06035 [Saprospiraceae bacterium]|nr:hypothetical protein [Saprospiraceae bacterium]MBP7699559.1 hypothetical protein [Saprospiraceae bacterium]